MRNCAFSLRRRNIIFNSNLIGRFFSEVTKASLRPVFKPSSQKTNEEKQKDAERLEKELYYHYGGKGYYNQTNLYSMYEFFAKKERNKYLNTSSINPHKHVIDTVRYREKTDLQLKLAFNSKEMVGILNPAFDFPRLDLIFKKHQILKLEKYYKLKN